MKRFLFAFAALALTFAPPAAWGNARSGVVTVEVDLSQHPAGQEGKLWLPYPVSDKYQAVTDVKVTGDYAASGVYTDRANGTPILFARWDERASSRKVSLSFKVTREEIEMRHLPGEEPAWNRADYAEYLKPTSLGPTDGEVQKLAFRIVKGKKTVLEKARAVYDWTCENMYRDPNTRGCGKGDVCELLRKPGGKCTDISSVYVALARSAGVPAREVFGLRLSKKPEEEITGFQHCWVEFFLPGTGWVPVDPADVRKAMLVEKLELDAPRTRALREYFFGGIDPYRFKLASGRDLVLTPAQGGAPLNTFGYPYAEMAGKPLDFYDPKGFVYRITFREKGE